MLKERSTTLHSRQDSTDLKSILSKYLYHWPLFLIWLFLAFTIAFAYLQIAQPRYEINAKILIKDEARSAEERPLLAELEQSGSSKNAETEIEILKSKNLISRVVDTLQLWAAYKIGRGIKTYDLYETKPFLFVASNKAKISGGELKILIKSADSFELPREGGTGKLIKFGEEVKDENGTWTLEKTAYTDNYIGSTIILSLISRNRIIDIYAKSIDARLLNKSTPTIGLYIQDEVPERGKDILGNLIKVYNEATLTEKERRTQSTVAFIENRLASLTGELTSAEKEVEGYRSSQGLTNIASQSEVYLQNVQSNDSKLNEVNVQLNVIEGIERYINSSSNSERTPATIGIPDPTLNDKIENLAQLRLKRASLLASTPEGNPVFNAIDQQIAVAKAAIRDNISAIKNSLLNTKRELQSFNSKYESSIRNIPEQERQYISMKRQLAIKENLYVYLLQKREELSLRYASTLQDARIVDYPNTGDKKWPKIPFIFAIALIAGITIPFLILYIRYSAINKITSKSEIESALNTKVVGEIYHSDAAEKFLALDKSDVISEQFRTLRTNLYYLHDNKQGKGRVNLFTSSISNEGKSFVCLNLAVSLAAAGRKTIVLELDLRKPKILQQLNLKSGHPGITEYLSSDCAIDEIIRPSGVLRGLDVIGSGYIAPNPSELLEKDRLHELISNLRTRYDDILIDSPPLHLVTDAMIISRLADVTLYIIKQGHTGKVELDFIEDVNSSGKINNMHIIFNGIKKEKYGYGYKYDGSYYSHGAKSASFALNLKSFANRF